MDISLNVRVDGESTRFYLRYPLSVCILQGGAADSVRRSYSSVWLQKGDHDQDVLLE